MNTVRILFDLRSGFGIGDGVQTSILWRHLRKYRPNWVIDVRAPGAFAPAIRPFVHAFWPSEGVDPTGEYEAVHQLNWTDCFETFADRPSTKVAFALKNVFGIEEYDPALGRYGVEFDPSFGGVFNQIVACHFEGNSHPERKNLSPQDQKTIISGIHDLRHCEINADTFKSVMEMASGIGICAAFVGIDSGPGKVASATDTPTLICWTGHHPLRYHDPAPNTTHLMPERHWEFPPFNGKSCFEDLERYAADYFAANYKWRCYLPGQLAAEACRWLREVLG